MDALRRHLVIGLIFCCPVSFASGGTFYVNGSCGNDSWSGTSEACQAPNGPKGTIQAGIDAASNGDLVIVKDGTYEVFDEDASGIRRLAFANGLPLGQTRLITVRSENGPANCVVDCNGTQSDPCRGFDFYKDNATRQAVLDGFTIREGYVSTGTNAIGGGIRVVDAEPTIRDCVIEDNSAPRGGGIGMEANPQTSRSALIENCTIRNNDATVGTGNDGGGIYCTQHMDAEVNGCLIEGNVTDGRGGGAHWSVGSEVRMSDCEVRGNQASGNGGGIYFEGKEEPDVDRFFIRRCTIGEGNISVNGSGGGIALEGVDANARIVNCFIFGNHAGSGGGAVAMLGPNPGPQQASQMAPWLVNLTATGNTATTGGGLLMRGQVAATIADSTFSQNAPGGVRWEFMSSQQPAGLSSLSDAVVWGNTPAQGQVSIDQVDKLAVAYSNIQGGWTGTGNINADPLFRDPEGPDTVAGTTDDDLRLSDGSPCIDAGGNPSVPPDLADVNNNGNTGEKTPWDLDELTRFREDLFTADTGVAGEPDCLVVDMGAYEFQRSCTDDSDCDDEDPCTGSDSCVNGKCEVSLTDCNENCIADVCDISENESDDCNANGVPDECEQGSPFPAQLVGCNPQPDESLWRTGNNIVRLTFACDITAPGSGKVEVRQLQASGQYGSDLSSAFSFTVENSASGYPRILTINGEAESTLSHKTWYTILNDNEWNDAAAFDLHYVVMQGDATNDNRVLSADVLFIAAQVPTDPADDDAREDINGDGEIQEDDYLTANGNVPSFEPTKPNGHECVGACCPP